MSNNASQKQIASLGSVASVLVLAGFFVFFYLNPLGLNALYKTLIFLSGVVLAVLVFFQSPQGHRLLVFLKETKIELRKVIWPTRDETIKTTGMILVAVIIIAIFLWIVDAFFTWAVQLLTN